MKRKTKHTDRHELSGNPFMVVVVCVIAAACIVVIADLGPKAARFAKAVANFDVPALQSFVQPWPDCPEKRAKEILLAAKYATESCDALKKMYQAGTSPVDVWAPAISACVKLDHDYRPAKQWFTNHYGEKWLPKGEPMPPVRNVNLTRTQKELIEEEMPDIVGIVGDIAACISADGKCGTDGLLDSAAAIRRGLANMTE